MRNEFPTFVNYTQLIPRVKPFGIWYNSLDPVTQLWVSRQLSVF